MPAPDAAVEHYRIQRSITTRTWQQVRALWATLSLGALDESWFDQRLGERLFTVVSTGQLLAAGQADRYLTAVLEEQGISPTAVARVQPRAFAGVASDGRSLDSLLYEPIITTKVARRSVPDAALRRGEAALARIVTTQVADASRASVSVGMTARPAVTGYVRMVEGDACSRCVVLAGRWYRYDAGFARHPQCSCDALPSREDVAGDFRTDPDRYFEQLSEVDQDRTFTKAGAEAIRDGADIARVVNSRGLEVPAGRRTPSTILDQAKDRSEAVSALRSSGYLI